MVFTKPLQGRCCFDEREECVNTQAVSAWRREQDEAREENLREHIQTYVTEGCRSATKYCDAYSNN